MTSNTAGARRDWRELPGAWLIVPIPYLILIYVRRAVLPPTVEIAFWPTSGLAAIAFMQLRPPGRAKAAVAMALGALLLGLTAGSFARALAGTIEAMTLGLLAIRVCGLRPNFSELRMMLRFVAGAAAPACLASTTVIYLASIGSDDPFSLQRASEYFVGHLLGAATFAPALLILLQPRRFAIVKGPGLEMAASLTAIVLVTLAIIVFASRLGYAYLIFPIAMMVAFRHGPLGSAAACLILNLIALASYVLEARSGGSASPVVQHVRWLQVFVATVFLTTLPAAGSVASNARVRALLARRTTIARLARHRAEAAAKAKGEFLANMSHEIRTPLNGVIGLADALSRTKLTASQRDLLKMILASGKALTGLLTDALDLARADSGALRLSIEPFDVRQTLREAAFLFETIAGEKGLAFAVELELDAPTAVGDSLRIKQIVSNLISNAVKFTERGSVRVHCRLEADAAGKGLLTVAVRDTGPGFGEEVRARLFNRFEQGDSSITRRYGGSGLGLAIAARLAQLMGGRLDCVAAPGAGATFTLTLPVGLHDCALPAGDGGDEPLAETEQLKILLAEDNHVNQKVVQAMLGRMAQLTIVGDGEAAVAAFRDQRFDVILMDTHMPVLDGLSAIRRIRAEEQLTRSPRTPIISLTADAMSPQIEAARAAGADLHIAKPITADALIYALKASLKVGRDARAA